ncbi:carboxyl transferase domain-containing protein [Nocardioides sp. AE5]|uniref:carboxyl transferase domain-containing protein n=1 Tax=Nocardioides sp. AE5 TaxID=2962573 RepID=UPI0028829A5D|nr:carboxyl transferase domain-containing protein [Nocardioides sp. AE5]MDT0202734.1 carboxyl transferase domain-containing protein [Nocardioides sp. AE5]
MTISKLLVANRGEIAVRIIQTAATRGIATVAIAPRDDLGAGHVVRADDFVELTGSGPAAYLDADQIVQAAVACGCDAVHPGYGFLSENAGFAAACEEAGIVFLGPTAETLAAFGDKTAARRVAESLAVPLLAATSGPTTLEEAYAFFDGLGADPHVMVKAIAGGGGRGMAPVSRREDLATAYERCASEARSAFGNGDLYVEELLTSARHIEVQIIGDGQGAVSHLWDRDCSVQRRRQKVVELAPAAGLPDDVRAQILDSAVAIGRSLDYRGLGTVEFLVQGDKVAFLEVNPRIQVEHTVTEEIIGLDLVAQQLAIGEGATLAQLGLDQADIAAPRRSAMQVRVTTDTLASDGSVVSGSGTLTAFQPPSGPGVRVDTHAHVGMSGNPRYDSLLAKVIVSEQGDGLSGLAARASRALREFVVAGVNTNIPLLQAILGHDRFLAGDFDTNFVERHLEELLGAPTPTALIGSGTAAQEEERREVLVPEGMEAIRAPMAGIVVSVDAAEGDDLAPGATLLVLEAMKMEHVVLAELGGRVEQLTVEVGDVVDPHQVLALITVGEDHQAGTGDEVERDLDEIRADLAEVLDRKQSTMDVARPDAVAKRRSAGRRTARENIADLLDDDSFVEYGGLLLAAQRQRRSLDQLVEKTPADGLVGGIGSVAGNQVVVMSYDYTVMAGTQGFFNHAKMRRLFDIADRQQLPVVMFVEGGGGRPGDTDMAAIAQLDEETFSMVARLSGKVPLVSIAAGRTFAGNAALASVSDLIIATEDVSIGMGGPAMIEGGGLGVYAPEEVGPMDIQVPNGVIDVLVKDEAAAVDAAKSYLLQVMDPRREEYDGHDERLLRHVIPENRLRAYDVREAIRLIADVDSLLEIRPEFGVGIITAFARLHGRAIGIVANNPRHLGGAIDSPAAEKAARFLQLCDAHGLPVLSLVDTPGFMVGPDAERTASVRRFGRLFLAGANITVPVVAVVLRKGYGLGAMAMAGGDLKAPLATLSWPTGEFGGMGLEGGVRLGFKAELEAIEDPDLRQKRFQELVDELYERGKALNIATVHEVDDVIDPSDTRSVVAALLAAAAPRREAVGRRYIDAW